MKFTFMVCFFFNLPLLAEFRGSIHDAWTNWIIENRTSQEMEEIADIEDEESSVSTEEPREVDGYTARR